MEPLRALNKESYVTELCTNRKGLKCQGNKYLKFLSSLNQDIIDKKNKQYSCYVKF